MNLKSVHNRAIAVVKMAESIQINNPTMDPKDCMKVSRNFFLEAENFIDIEIKNNIGMGKGDLVKCVDNKVMDEGYNACEELELEKTYQVVEVLSDGMIKVDDFTSTLDVPFYPERFKKVVKEESQIN